MALKLISTLTILVLAAFLYKVWDKTKVPEEMPAEDVWKVKTIEFVCRLLHKLMDLMVYLNVDPHDFGRPTLSFMFGILENGIWPFTSQYNNSITMHRRQMDGVPVLHFKYNNKLKNPKGQPVIIYFHGGGWEWLDAEYPKPALVRMTQELKIPSLSVEYRLAPEHPFPAALEDCLKVTNYVLAHHKTLAVDPTKLIVAGDSAGGNLAAAVALRLKKKVRLQILVYPGLQGLDFQTPSYRENGNKLKYILSPKFVATSVANYLGLPAASLPLLLENKHISQATRESKYASYIHSDLMASANINVTRLTTINHTSMSYSADTKLVHEIEQRVLDPNFSPLMSHSLDNVSDAYIITAQHDVLRDDGIFYYSRLLKASNVKCVLKNYSAAFHAFFYFIRGPLQLQVANEAVNDVIQFIQKHVLEDHPWPPVT